MARIPRGWIIAGALIMSWALLLAAAALLLLGLATVGQLVMLIGVH